MPLNLPLLKEASIIGVWYGPWAERHNDELWENVGELTAMVEAGSIRPRCSEAFPLDDFVDAFRVITERRVLGKVVLAI